ncbi:MAG: cyclodeaminase/cyclohydrolase family protein [Clostridiales Family XIII bacterium]|jgi:formiminotetrahydrofolate cyclodeaminase|nr:cyclodeaminase/cyclohydrolase family protein [Clostridiales Family XIII bacterium]
MGILFGRDKKDSNAPGGVGIGHSPDMMPRKKLLVEKPVDEFVGMLSSKAPVPGGGGAAALCGALGAALGGMVANLTIGKQKYADSEEELNSLKVATYRIQKDLLDLAQKDADAFEPLITAYRMPKGSEAEKDQRGRIIEMRTKDAAEVPIEMMRKCAEAIGVMDELVSKGSRMAMSDAACGAVLAAAGMKSAWLNVIVNTSALKDRDYSDRLESEGRELLEKYLPFAEEICGRVEALLLKK